MLELALEYGLFLAKAITIVVAFGAVVVLIAGVARRDEGGGGHLKIDNINDRMDAYAHELRTQTMSKKERKTEDKARKKAKKLADKAAPDPARKRIFVVDFRGDIRASGVPELREEISAILSLAGENDSVLLRLENAGGIVHDHGLAASQLVRLRQRGVPLTIAVDKVAASGGYMMACVGNRIIAAPFAVLGSIGVLAQLPNFHRLMRDNGIDFEIFMAGDFKRTVTMFGENTDEGRQKFTDEIQQTHQLFKDFVAEHRPRLDMDAIATGEHWYGRQALERKLCDEIKTSDDWLIDQAKDADLYEIQYKRAQPLSKRLMESFEGSFVRVLDTLLQRNYDSRFQG